MCANFGKFGLCTFHRVFKKVTVTDVQTDTLGDIIILAFLHFNKRTLKMKLKMKLKKSTTSLVPI